jgi:superfamily II DNA or RNA helicase
MVKFEYEDPGKLLITWFSKNNFAELVETAKFLKLRFVPEKHGWEGDAVRLEDYVADFMTVEECEVSELTKIKIEKYRASLSELKRVRRRLDLTKMRLPPLVGKHPYEDFQKTDAMRAFCQNRFLNAGGTGTGKTYWMAEILDNFRRQLDFKKALIFSSSIGMFNVKSELCKFMELDPDSVLVVGGVTGVKSRDFFSGPHDVIIMTYDAMKYCQDYYYKLNHPKVKKATKFRVNQVPIKEWLGDDPGLLFMDECHLLGHPGSRRNECMRMIIDLFEFRYLSSATPWDELAKAYTILNSLSPELVDGLGYQSWLAEYYDIGTRWSRYAPDLKTIRKDKERALNTLLYKEYGVVRRKEDVLNIPPQVMMPTTWIAMSPEHREIYEQFSQFIVNDKAANTANKDDGENIANLFSFAMLAVENPKVIEDTKRETWEKLDPELRKKIKAFKYGKSFEKLRVLDAIIEDECDERDNKIVIFYQHPRTLEELRSKFDKSQVVEWIVREMSKDERFATVQSFQKSTKSRILVASINIANTSISLTSAKAMVMFERTWNYSTYDQALGRISRPGQTEETRVYTIGYENSLDGLQLKNLENKGDTVRGIMKRTTLSEENWRSIFDGTF